MAKIYDSSGGVVRWVDETPDGRGMVFGTTQECQSVQEHNKALQNLNDGYSPSRTLRRKWSIPVGLAQQWIMEAGLNPAEFWQWPRKAQNDFFRRRINSNEYSDLRTVA